MKKILLSVSVISLVCAADNGVFNTNFNKIMKENKTENVTKKVSKTNKKLEKEITDLKKEIKNLREYIDENLDDLNERVDENEFQSSLNKIKWSGELENTVGFFRGKTNGIDYSNSNMWILRAKLNMEANINEKTKFHGRLMMSKRWADYSGNMAPDAYAGRNTNSGDALYVERAYVDLKINPKLILTVGRQPSSDGPGMSLKYDTPRKATYPALIFNGAADGIVLTYKPTLSFVKKPAVRFAYGKGYQRDHNQDGFNAKIEGKDTNVYALLLESKLKDLSNNLLIFTAVKLTNLADFNFTTPDMFQPQNSKTPVVVPVPNGKNVGDMNVYGLYFEQNKVAKKFNYFISLAMNQPVNRKSPNFLKDTGYAYHIGARYDFNKHFKFGVEYNYGSKYWFSMNPSSLDPVEKLQARGKAKDVYLIYRMDLNNLFRIGFTRIDYDYTYSGSYIVPGGEPTKTDDYNQVFYLTYDVRF